jgi:hypothetical protein
VNAATVGSVCAILLSCGPDPTNGGKYECVQIGPSVGYPIRPQDVFIATGFNAEDPTLMQFSLLNPGDNFVGLSTEYYPQICFSSYEDQPNYHIVAWIDDYVYRDGGLPPEQTYCTSLDDPNCHPQPGQPHGEVTLTLRGHENNVIIVPLTP